MRGPARPWARVLPSGEMATASDDDGDAIRMMVDRERANGREAAPSPSTVPDAPLVAAPPAPALAACVVVPARDEAANLTATLAALAAQTDLAGRALDLARFEVIVLANNCADGTAGVARHFGRRHPALRLHVVEQTLLPGEAHVGRARRLLMDEARRRLALAGQGRGLIASTDADTLVEPAWLAATLREVALGADAVFGRILSAAAGGDGVDRAARLYQLRDAAYRLLVSELDSLLDPDPADPWPRHHQHFGASLAVTAEAYARAGGLPATPVLEDMAFHAALRRIDARIRHSPAVRVFTSARRAGRVPVGLSTQLGEWAAMARAGAPWLVEGPDAVEAWSLRRRALRAIWREEAAGRRGWDRRLPAVAAAWGIEPAWLETELARAPTFGQLAAAATDRRRDRGRDGGEPLWDARAAVPALRRRVAALRRPGPATTAAETPRSTLPPLEHIQPVRLLPPAPEEAEAVAFPDFGEEGVVDLVAG